MKSLLTLPLLLIVTLSACSLKESQPNQFLSTKDTLIIESKKTEGHDLFMIGASNLSFRDSTEWKSILEWYNLNFTYPENLRDSKIGITSIMLKTLRYFDRVTNDTIQLNIFRPDNIIGIATGKIDNREVFIVDQNNNRDFRDDSIRFFNEWVWMSDDNLIKCKYEVEKKNETISDSGWIKIGKWKDQILKTTCQHMIASFTIDNIQFKLGVADRNSTSFCFFSPVFALLGENGILRDTLLERDILNLGEFIRLGKYYYKIEDFYSGSGTIELIKINDFENKIGVQVGTIAPSFKFISTDGDTVYSSSLNNSDLLIANVSGCTPSSFEIFNKIQNSTFNKLKLIGINSGVCKDLKGPVINVEDHFNNEVYNIFRNAYSSYDCFLINMDGRIIDKFSVFDWESHLSAYIK
jgi:hypothetical protein